MKTEFKINVVSLFVVVLIIVGGLLATGYYYSNQDTKRWKHNYDVAISDFKTYRSETDGKLITYKEALVLKAGEINELLEQDSISRKLIRKYKNVSGKTTIVTEFETDTIRVPVPYLVVANDTSFTIDENCFKLDLSLSNGLLGINGLDIHNRQDIIVGARKSGLWKTTQSVDVRNSNECITVTGLQHYTVKNRKKWWENPLLTIPIGFATGFIVSEIID